MEKQKKIQNGSLYINVIIKYYITLLLKFNKKIIIIITAIIYSATIHYH
jgi:hypothetical protein